MIFIECGLCKPVSNRAQAAVGTLIIFISMLLVAAIAAGVLLQTTGSLQEKTLTTGDQVRDDVSSGFHIVDVSGRDGTNGFLNYITMIVKLPPGTPAMNLDYLTMVIGTENVTSNLKYRGASGTTKNDNTGYNTWLSEELGEAGSYYELVNVSVDNIPEVNLNLDIDMDGLTDTIVVCDDARPFCVNGYSGTHVLISLSSGEDIYVPIYDQNGGPINLANKADGETIKTEIEPIGSYGFLTAIGPEGAGSYVIPANTIKLYLNYIELAEDLDDDGENDAIVINDTHIILLASSKGNITQQLNKSSGLAFATGADLSTGAQTLNISVDLTDNDSNRIFGSVTISGDTTRASYIDEGVSFRVIPDKIYQGYFSSEYVQTSPNYIPGILQTGDIIRLYAETPRNLYEDESLRITLLPKNGVQTVAEFYMPNIISDYNTHMYP